MTWALESLENLHFNGLVLTKVYNVWAKKYRGVIFHDTRSDTKFEEQFSPEQTKVSKLGLSLGPFIQSTKCMSLKFTGELCVMTMKNDAKFEKELTCQFKIDMTWGI